MGRPRSSGSKELPPNLYRARDRRGFRYVNPVTKRGTSWPLADRQGAIAAAQKLNAQLMLTNDLVSTVLRDGHSFNDAIKVFREKVMPGKRWSKKTAEEHEFRFNRIAADIGKRDMARYGVREIAQYLDTVTSSLASRARIRLLLVWLYKVAISQGWIKENPAAATLEVVIPDRQRERLTLPVYEKIHRLAGERGLHWFQRAMEIALVTLLRRGDICTAKFTDIHDGALHVVPSKTEDSTHVRLRIHVDAELGAVVEKCRDRVLSPYLIHRLPQRMNGTLRERRRRGMHHTQVHPRLLSDTFKELREASGACRSVKHPPTFHEIRSLGADLKRQKGWSAERLSPLMAHSDVQMTRHYLEGHEPPWTDVSLG